VSRWAKIKDFNLDVKGVSEQGVFTGRAATWEVDRQMDRIQRGAFRDAIKSGQKIPILWQHQTTEPIGMVQELQERQDGLWIRAKLAIETDMGKKAYNLLRFNPNILDLSIGFSNVQADYTKENGKTIRVIKSLRLWEISLVTFPAQPGANVTSVKSGYGNSRAEVIESLKQIKRDFNRDIRQLKLDHMEKLQQRIKTLDDISSQLRKIETDMIAYKLAYLLDEIEKKSK